MLSMRLRAVLLGACFSLLGSISAAAPADEAGKDAVPREAKEAAKPDDIKLPPFPADKTIHQTTQVGGKTLAYDATVGSLPVLDEKGKT
ncbi:MAG: peptidase S10, partial [Rudaea sp.]